MSRAFCTTCRTMVEVEDEFDASTMKASGEFEYRVTALACGHQVEGPLVRVGAAPGAPYAGVKGFASYRSFTGRRLHPSGEVDL